MSWTRLCQIALVVHDLDAGAGVAVLTEQCAPRFPRLGHTTEGVPA